MRLINEVLARIVKIEPRKPLTKMEIKELKIRASKISKEFKELSKKLGEKNGM